MDLSLPSNDNQFMPNRDNTSAEVSRILRDEKPDLDRLLPLVYDKLKEIAARRMA